MLDAGDGRFLGPTTQIGNSLWNVHTVNVDGHARFRVYKFSTTGTAPLLTFTPTILGTEDLFNATMATGSETAGSRAFVSASAIAPGVAGAYVMSFTGPNDSAQGWSFDIAWWNAIDFATSETTTPTSCNASAAGSCAWTNSSGTAMDPSDPTTAWVFNQYTIGTNQTNWAVAGAAVSGGGTGAPPLAPIASAATGISLTGFTANWSAQPPATGYQLDVATDAAFSASVSAGGRPASLLAGYPMDVGNVTSFAVTGLSPATTYYYRVRAIASGYSSLSSNTISVATFGGLTCTLNADPDSISSGDSSTLTWASANATSGSMDNGVGSLTPVGGGTVSVSPTSTTTYTATFTGPGGSTTCSAIVTIPGTTAIGPLELLALSLLAFAGLGLRLRRAA